MDMVCERIDRQEFVDILKRMLCMDQEKRINPFEGLHHPFITMNHLIEYGLTK